MASNVSNLLKEKIVTPVANSVAAQVDNKVKNGIILRKFIGVQLGESNTGCQLVKIDLNKINVKDPSYEFTLYIKAFSQKGLFNFIINVNKTDSLQVDVKCEVKNSVSNNGEAIGYYDVDTVGNTITVSLVKDFVVNTSINECKFVSTKDTLNISDLDIDWSDTGNVKTDTSIDIKGKESNIEIAVDKYLSIDCGTLSENQRYRIATIDYSKLSEAKYFDGTSFSPGTGSIGCFIRIKIASNLLGMMTLEIKPLLLSSFDISSAMVILESKGTLTFSIDSDTVNIDAFLYKRKNKSIQIFYNNDLFSTTSKDTIHVFSCEIISLNAKLDPDTIKVTFDMDTTTVTDRLYEIQLENGMNLYKVFTTNVNSIVGPSFNGLVPGPNKNEADNKYLLGADAKWHPRKTENEYIADLKPTEEIKGLSETDTTKGISFVTFDFNTLSQKVVEAAPSTLQEFDINMKVLTRDLGIITISTSLTVTKAGIIVCNSVLSDRGMGSNSVSFSTSYSGKLGAVTTPGFFVNDYDTKIFKIALYTPIAIDGVKIIDVVVTSYSDIIDESDITFTWELGILEKKPPQLFRSNIIYPRIDLDRELVFDQMDIETPISETDEDTLFAEQIKHNGLVPAPGKYEVNNGYYLKADGSWDNPVKVLDVIHSLDPGELGEQESYRIVSLDLTKFGENDFGGNYSPDIYIDILSWKYGLFYLKIRPAWATSKKILLYSASFHMKETDRSIYNNSNGSITPPFKIRKTNTSIELYYASDMLQNSDTIQILSYNVIPNTMVEEYNPKDHIVVDWSLQKIDTTSIQLSPFNHYYLGYDTIFSSSDDPNSILNNGLVPHPTSLQEENGYYLKADGSWDLPKRGNNNFISIVTPREEMTSQVSSTVGITFVTFDYSKIIESLSLAVNTGSGFEGVLIINTKLFGEILINFSVSLFNLNGTINKGATAYANVGTKSAVHINQISLIQNTYGADIKTPVFIYTDSVNNICKIGLYGSASKSPVIIKDCTLNQTYTDFDVNDITITWEPTTITISEENTNDASLFTNMDWSKTFTPMTNMTDPDGSYSENNLRRWKLQNNGLVPAPAKYEADQGHVLCADGTWKKMESGSNFTAVPITLDPTKYQEAYETQTNPDTSKKTIMFMNLDISSIVATGTNITKIELSMYSPIYGTSRLVIDTMINSIKNRYCVNEDANGAGFYMDYCLAVAEVENSGFTGKDDTKIESFYTFVIDGDIIKIGISPIIFKLLNGTTPPFPIVTLEDCKVFIQSITDGSTSTDISEIPISYEQSTYTLNSVYGANHNGWIAKNTIFSAYVDYDTRDFQSLHNGLVPAPTKVEVEEGKFLKADGTWAIPPSTRGNDNYITKVERDPSTVDQVSATKATSFLTIDYSTICEQLGAATGDAGQADANIFTSLEVMVPVWGKIQISIVSFLSDNWFSVLVYSDAGTGWYTDNIAYKIHSDISDNELHTRPGFYTMDDVNKTITLGMYGSYGADEIAIIDCTSIAVGEGFSVDDMIYNYDRQLIDIPESAKDFDEIGITRNTVFQSMAYADTDPDGTKYLYQRGNYNGLVPAPAKYDVTHNYMLRPNGTWGPIEGIIRNRTFTVTPYTDSSSTQTNDYVITEGAEDLAIAINENYSVDINIVFSGLGSKNNTNTTLIITGVTGTVNLYDYSGNPIKYITDGMSMKCTIFKNTIDDPVESMNAYCIYDIISYPDTMNGPSE